MQTIRSWLTPPQFEDERKTQQAFLLNAVVLALIFVPLPLAAYYLISSDSAAGRLLIQVGIYETINLAVLILLWRGRVQAAAVLHAGLSWIFFTVSAFTGAGVNGTAYMLGNAALIVLTGALLGRRMSLAMAGLSLLGGAFMVLADLYGWVNFIPLTSSTSTWMVSLTIFSVLVFAQYTSERALLSVTERANNSIVQYQQLFEAAPNGICIVDQDNHILMVNPAICDLLGYTRDEVLGRNIVEFLDPRESADRPPRPAEVLRPLGATHRERTLRHKNGSAIRAAVSGQAVPNGHYQYIIQDISAHKAAEEYLLRRETILEAVAFAAQEFLKSPNWREGIETVMARLGEELRASHVYFFEHDTLPDGTQVGSMAYEWAAPGQVSEVGNPEFQNTPLLEDGFERQYEILKRGEVFVGNSDSFTPVEKAYQAKIGIKALLEVPIMIAGEWWGTLGFDDYVHERTWTAAEVSSLKIAGSVVSAAIQRQMADAAVHEAEKIYRQAIESAGAVPYYLDYATQTYRFIGAGIQQITGYTPAEMNSAIWRSMLVETQMLGNANRLTYAEALQKSKQGELPIWRCDNHLRTRSGELRWLNDSAIEIIENGFPVGAIGILQDITERKQNEAILRAITFAAEQFMQSPNWRVSQQTVLEQLGHAINASHAYLFENHPGPDGVEVASIRFEWSAPSFKSDLDVDVYQNLPLNEDGFERWNETLSQGQPFVNGTYSMPADELEFLQARNIFALLDMPIFVKGKWWGTIGFDEMSRPREWTPAEVDLLKVAADVLSAAIAREQMDSDLRTAELRFRTLVEQIPAITYIDTADGSGLTLYISPQVESILGVAAEAWQKGDIDFWLNLIAPEYRDAARTAYIHSSQTGEPFDMEYKVNRSDGQARWVHDRAFVLRDENGQPLWIHGIIFDTTERRAADETLRQYAARFELLHQIDRALRSEQSTQAIAQTAAHNLRMLMQCDRVSVTLFDFEAQTAKYIAISAEAEFQYLTAGAVVSMDAFGQYMIAALQNDQPYVLTDLTAQPQLAETDRLSYEKGMRSWLYLPLYSQKDLIGSLNLGTRTANSFSTEQAEVAREVANQLAIAIHQSKLFETIQNMNVNLEAMVKQRTAELENANKELGAFSYSVSHDLRSPLRAISSYSQILKADYGNLLPEEGLDYLNQVIDGTRKMGELIEALLALARTTRGDLRKVHLDISALVHDILDTFQQNEPDRVVTVQVEDGLIVHADEKLLVNILHNLLGNAWKYTSRTPQAQITFGAEHQNGQTVYFIRDNGAGFDMKYRDKLFHPFQRLHNADDFPGHGIGLASVQRIIHRHGGEVWAASEPNKGATFYFTLG